METPRLRGYPFDSDLARLVTASSETPGEHDARPVDRPVDRPAHKPSDGSRGCCGELASDDNDAMTGRHWFVASIATVVVATAVGAAASTLRHDLDGPVNVPFVLVTLALGAAFVSGRRTARCRASRQGARAVALRVGQRAGRGDDAPRGRVRRPGWRRPRGLGAGAGLDERLARRPRACPFHSS